MDENWFEMEISALQEGIAKPGYPCFYAQTADLNFEALHIDCDPVAVTLPFARRVAQQSARAALLLICEPTENDSLNSHRERFWSILQTLHDNDPVGWPAMRNPDPDSPGFMFTFAGVSFYPFALSPYYERRVSRKSQNCLVICLVPQCAFSGIERGTPKGVAVRNQIHERVFNWDERPLHPSFQESVWQGYFLEEEESFPTGSCPFTVRYVVMNGRRFRAQSR